VIFSSEATIAREVCRWRERRVWEGRFAREGEYPRPDETIAQKADDRESPGATDESIAQKAHGNRESSSASDEMRVQKAGFGKIVGISIKIKVHCTFKSKSKGQGHVQKRAQHCVHADKGGRCPPFRGFSAFGVVRGCGFFSPSPALAGNASRWVVTLQYVYALECSRMTLLGFHITNKKKRIGE
jgi:hypothetical protein